MGFIAMGGGQRKGLKKSRGGGGDCHEVKAEVTYGVATLIGPRVAWPPLSPWESPAEGAGMGVGCYLAPASDPGGIKLGINMWGKDLDGFFVQFIFRGFKGSSNNFLTEK